MFYPFICPECGHKETITMRITEYTAEGHKCPSCKTEMKRDPKSLACGMSIDKTGDFYRRCN
jgi:predicted nucleic acid-binding Zn ribbon protein